MGSRSEDPHNKLYPPPPLQERGDWVGRQYCCVDPRSLKNNNYEPIVIKINLWNIWKHKFKNTNSQNSS